MSGLAAAPSEAIPSSRHLSSVGMLLIAITILIAGFTVWDLHEEAIESHRRDIGNLGVVLAEQMSRSVQAVDLVMRDTRQKIVTGAETPEEFKSRVSTAGIHTFLADQLKSLPQAAAIILIDAEGKVANFSRRWPIPVLDTSKRDFYLYFLDHDDPDIFVSVPIRAQSTGTWTFYLARRINNSNGQFLGLVLGAIEIKYLEDFYEAITLQKGSSVSVLRRDGTVLATYPHGFRTIGTTMPPASDWYKMLEAGGGSYRSAGRKNGVKSLVSVNPLREYPLVVDIGIAEAAALASWWAQSAVIAIGSLCAAVGFGVLFRVINGQFRRLERSEASLATQNAELAQSRTRLEAQTSQLRSAAAALRESERRFRDFALTSSDWFWEQGADLRFVRISETEVAWRDDLGKTRWEVPSYGVTEEQWADHKADLWARRPFRDFLFQRVGTDGVLHHLSISGQPAFDEAGTFIGYRGTGRDISAQIRTEEALRLAKEEAEAASQTKSQFLANMSHELRTPLNAIMGFSEVIRDARMGPVAPHYRGYAGDIHSAGTHLLGLINDLLDLSKVEVGRLELHEEKVTVAEVIDTCCRLIRDRAREGGVVLEVEMPPDRLILLGDTLRLKQIILNLLSNAVKFTPRGGRVVIRIGYDESGCVVMSVTDTGIGMSREDIPVALSRFRQLEGAFTRRYDGTGLGLPLAKSLTELHGGTLEIESEIGRGTTVRVRLPRERILSRTPLEEKPEEKTGTAGL